MTAVMMIGGGIQEVRAVQVAKSLGFEVIVTDRNPHAPAFRWADFSAIIDGRDIEGLVAFTLLKKQRLGIAGVFTLTELVTSVAAIALAADLPGVSLSSAVACQNKVLCKEIWQQAGVPTPRGKVAYTIQEAVDILEQLGGKAFVKLVAGFGGQGAGQVNSSGELKGLIRQQKSIRSEFVPVIVEELLTGTHHDVNGLIDAEGTFHPLGIVDRYFLNEWPVEREIRTPSVLSGEEQKELYELLEMGVRALGIHFGPVKGDAVFTTSGFKLLEVAPRLHGPKNSLYALPMSGFEPLVPTLLIITGQNVQVEKLRLHQDRYCICRALLPPPGRVLRITGIEEARRLPGIEHVMLFAKEGSVVPGYRDSTHVPGYVFATGQSLDTCEEALGRAMSVIHFEIGTIQ